MRRDKHNVPIIPLKDLADDVPLLPRGQDGRRKVGIVKFIARGFNSNRRWFMKNAIAVAGVASTSASLSAGDNDNGNGKLSKGDAAMLRLAAAAEILESDFWIQYNELGGIQDTEVSGGSGIPAYKTALQVPADQVE